MNLYFNLFEITQTYELNDSGLIFNGLLDLIQQNEEQFREALKVNGVLNVMMDEKPYIQITPEDFEVLKVSEHLPERVDFNFKTINLIVVFFIYVVIRFLLAYLNMGSQTLMQSFMSVYFPILYPLIAALIVDLIRYIPIWLNKRTLKKSHVMTNGDISLFSMGIAFNEK